MLMRKLILCIVCIFSALCASAQTKVTWSMELGLGMSTWMGNGSDGSNHHDIRQIPLS